MRRIALSCTLILCVLIVAQARAQTPKLKAAILLSGSNTTTDTLDLQAAPGLLTRELDFYSTALLDPSPSPGRLAVTSLRATTAPGDVVAVRASVINGTSTAVDGALLDVTLSSTEPLKLRISAEKLRAGATYTGKIILYALKETREWTLNVTTGASPVLVVDGAGALQFERSVWAWFCSWRDCEEPIGAFTFSVRGKPKLDAISNLHVRFEPSAIASSKVLRSNFTIDNFRFGSAKDPLSSPEAPPAAASCAAGLPVTATLEKPVWISACVSRLEPGEYAGALRLITNETAEDSADSKLTLAINVRDPRAIPIAVLILGSAIGWFTTKYLTAARKARDMARTVRLLRERADHLTRAQTGKQGWGFSDEAVSSALIKVRVALNRLLKLTEDGLPMLVEEAELIRVKDDAEVRLSRLEALRSMRVRVEQTAPIQPTIQRAVGRLLRGCSDLLDQPLFGPAQQADFTAGLDAIKPWANEETLLATYRNELAKRSAKDSAGVHASDIVAVLRPHVEKLLKEWPALTAINSPDATMVSLHEIDEKFEMLSLLSRDHKEPWASVLADACAKEASLHVMFDLVDEEFWKMMAAKAPEITIHAEAPSVDAYDLFRVHLTVPGIKKTRILVHPMHVRWTVQTGNQIRMIETEDLTLVQYCVSPGDATISAKLVWGAQPPIDVPSPAKIEVKKNPDYRGRQLFFQGGGLELIAVGLAMTFAVVTAMQTQYDATFGSTTQYLGLFIWAAGAATGGNILKQLGASSSPGGQAESSLPTRPG